MHRPHSTHNTSSRLRQTALLHVQRHQISESCAEGMSVEDKGLVEFRDQLVHDGVNDGVEGEDSGLFVGKINVGT